MPDLYETMRAAMAQTGLWHLGFENFPQGESHLLVLVYDRDDLDPEEIADILEGEQLGLKVIVLKPVENAYSFVAFSPVIPGTGGGTGTYTGAVGLSTIEDATGAQIAAAQKKPYLDPTTGKDPFASYVPPEPDDPGMAPILFGDDEIIPANTWVLLYVTWIQGQSENTASVRDRVRKAGYRSFSFDMGGPTAWLVSTRDWQVPSRSIVAFNPKGKTVTARKIKDSIFAGMPVSVAFVTNENVRERQDALEKLGDLKEAEDGVGDFFAWVMRNITTILFVAAGGVVAYYGWKAYSAGKTIKRILPSPRKEPARTETQAKAAGLARHSNKRR
jgi:hypothetical protein